MHPFRPFRVLFLFVFVTLLALLFAAPPGRRKVPKGPDSSRGSCSGQESGGAFGWIVAHGADLVLVVGSLVTVATVVARLTPSKRDDEIVGAISRFLDSVAIGGVKRKQE